MLQQAQNLVEYELLFVLGHQIHDAVTDDAVGDAIRKNEIRDCGIYKEQIVRVGVCLSSIVCDYDQLSP